VSSTPASVGQVTLVLESLAEAPSEPDSVADAPLVSFDAFLTDHHIYGWIRLAADRLTDVLNSQAELNLVNVWDFSNTGSTVTGAPSGRARSCSIAGWSTRWMSSARTTSNSVGRGTRSGLRRGLEADPGGGSRISGPSPRLNTPRHQPGSA
jgi:hypothetical protein